MDFAIEHALSPADQGTESTQGSASIRAIVGNMPVLRSQIATRTGMAVVYWKHTMHFGNMRRVLERMPQNFASQPPALPGNRIVPTVQTLIVGNSTFPNFSK
jgi:hypothetical protein